MKTAKVDQFLHYMYRHVATTHLELCITLYFFVFFLEFVTLDLICKMLN
jgi:hypothetical protein